MNLSYWLEQMKTTTAIAAYLAVPITVEIRIYLPMLMKAY
jgi:hypothetical protein